jgi:uncharacterized membrane protein
MELVFMDWIELLLRWTHVIVGIAWIGSSFFFVWLDLSLRKRDGADEAVQGEAWIVHGGGFYFMEKYLNAPERMPAELHWFKFEAYFTWITGFLLIAVIYYLGAESFLIDPSVRDLSQAEAIGISLAFLAGGWIVYDLLCRSPIGNNTLVLAVSVLVLTVGSAYVFSEVFSGRGAYVHAGAAIGTIMAANVFFIIIPNQKKTVAALIAGEVPDAKWGGQAKQRSLHNNYLTLPVILMMISSHYPMTYGHEYSWVIFGVVVVLGGVIRDFFNTHNAGGHGMAIAWQWPVSALLVLGLIWFTAPAIDDSASDEEVIEETEALAIVQTRCIACHSQKPSNPDFEKAPGGLKFDTLAEVRKATSRILAQTVLAKTMPLGNITEMTDEERRELGRWIRAGAPE